MISWKGLLIIVNCAYFVLETRNTGKHFASFSIPTLLCRLSLAVATVYLFILRAVLLRAKRSILKPDNKQITNDINGKQIKSARTRFSIDSRVETRNGPPSDNFPTTSVCTCDGQRAFCYQFD